MEILFVSTRLGLTPFGGPTAHLGYMNGWQGGLLATIVVFLPAFLLLLGALPFWDTLRNKPKIKGAIIGVNAAVVGILISALYNPI